MLCHEIENIRPISSYSCFEESLKNVCETFDKDFTCFFAKEWGFVYKQDKYVPISERFNIPFLEKMNQFIENYLGFKVSFYKTTNDLLNNIKDAIYEGDMIIIGLDSFGCNWNPAFMRTHVPHFFIIDNILEDGRKLFCRDTYYSNNIYTIELENIIKYFRNLRVFHNAGCVRKLDIIDIKNILVENYSALEQSPYYYFLAFAESLVHIENIDQLFEDKKRVGNCLLIQKLRSFKNNRIEISRLFLRYSEGENDKEIADEFCKLAEQWEFLKLLFIKLFVVKEIRDGILDNIIEVICNIGKCEENLYEKIMLEC